jgi:hypothetical protein
MSGWGKAGAGFVTWAGLVAFLVFIFPFGSAVDWSAWLKAMRAGNAIVIVGNSVIDHSSTCDSDRASIAELLARVSGSRVVDLSSSGQLLGESVVYAGIALKRSGVSEVIVPISYFSLADDWQPSFQRGIYLNLIGGGLYSIPVVDALIKHGNITGRALKAHEPFEYRGSKYPDYDRVKSAYMQTEKDVMGCPETNGRNSAFIEAYYHHAYLESGAREQNLQSLINLSFDAARRHKTLRLVLLPIDFEIVDGFSSVMGQELRRRVHESVLALRARGVSIEDLSGLLQNEAFADRWCACGHLLLQGRESVAMAMGSPRGSDMH